MSDYFLEYLVTQFWNSSGVIESGGEAILHADAC